MVLTARLRLTLGYLSVLTAAVGLVSVAPRHERARLVALDLGVLLLGARAADLLAGSALRPVRAAQARQERFAVAASHELRTPLTVLLGTLEAALVRRRTPAQYEDVLRRATAEAVRVAALLDDLLALAHGEDDTAPPATVPLDLHTVASAAAEDMRAGAAGKGQALAVALDGPLPTRGDARALHHAVSSLLDNAISYTAPGGSIRLVGRRTRGRALLSVRDTGPGIAPEHLAHLCEPFYRVDPARASAAGHMGLGLARAARIARAHGGRLAVESQVGVGTAVTLSLPLDRARPDAHGDLPRRRAPVAVHRTVAPARARDGALSGSSQEVALDCMLYPPASRPRPRRERGRRAQHSREGRGRTARHGRTGVARGSGYGHGTGSGARSDTRPWHNDHPDERAGGHGRARRRTHRDRAGRAHRDSREWRAPDRRRGGTADTWCGDESAGDRLVARPRSAERALGSTSVLDRRPARCGVSRERGTPAWHDGLARGERHGKRSTTRPRPGPRAGPGGRDDGDPRRGRELWPVRCARRRRATCRR